MDCLANLPRSSTSALPSFNGHRISASSIVSSLGNIACYNWHQNISMKAASGSLPGIQMSVPAVEQKRSEIYSHDMTQAMGAVLNYRHELGMNFNFIRPDLIVGSCLQNPQDIDVLHNIGVKTIFCLQQNSDLEYFGVDIKAIREYARGYSDIEHVRAEIRDFDGFDLRMRLPVVVSKLYDAITRNGGVTYVHCTAGLGRAPAVALAYMFWVQGYSLKEADMLLQGERPCFPKMDAIKSATADILTGFKRRKAVLAWKGSSGSTVEISGLDIGWSQRTPLKYDEERALWSLEKELPEGFYEYKYVVDGNWMCNMSEPLTSPNNDGNVNNYVEVVDDNEDENSCLRRKLMGENPNLTMAERLKIRQFLHTCCHNMEEHA